MPNPASPVHPFVALLVFAVGYIIDVLFYRYVRGANWAVLSSLTIALSLLLPAAVVLLYRRGFTRQLLLGKPADWKAALYLSAATLLLVPAYISIVLILAQHWMEVRRIIYWDVRDMQQVTRTTPWPLIAIGGLFFAFTEEFMYRGFLMNSLRRWGSAAALVLSALCFAAAHRTIGKLLPMTIAGLWFGYVALRSGSIWVSTSSHFIVNACLLGAILYFNPGVSIARTPLPHLPEWWLLLIVPAIGLIVILLDAHFANSRPLARASENGNATGSAFPP